MHYFRQNINLSLNEKRMNKMNKWLKTLGVFAVAITANAVSASAQQTSTEQVSTTATIVQPIAITKDVDLSFGNLNLNANGSAGAVILTPEATPTRTPSGTFTLPAQAGTVTAAKFSVAGAATYAYNVTIPAGSFNLEKSGGATTDVLVVNTFTKAPATGVTYVLDGTGNQTIYVGATINADGDETAGVYNSTATFPVTVQYQ
jgi:hypothetical protein